MARIRFSSEVLQQDVEEAMHLMHQCQSQLRHSQEAEAQRTMVDPITDIYHIIRDHSFKNNILNVGYVVEFFWVNFF